MLNEIKNKLKEKNINDTSINIYTRNLILLNDDKEFKNFNFLKNYDKINNYINNDKYKNETKRNYYNSISSILKLFSPKYKKLQLYYYNKFEELNNIIKKNDGIISPDKQKKYLEYKEIENIYNDLENIYNNINFKKDKLTKEEYNILLQYLTLSLYLNIPPRRNKDYIQMFIIPDTYEKLDNDKNYLLLKQKKFIFNDYKTSKIYNQQMIDIPEKLMNIIYIYYKFNPLNKNDNNIIPFLVSYKGIYLNSISAINIILNNINSHLSSTMIRHSYITKEFKENNDKSLKVSIDMAHSIYRQNKYIVRK